jgi:hypothetical protein
MTWIRIDPNEMEAGSRELQACSEAIGMASGAQAGAAGCAMPAAVSAQVEATLATVERQLHDLRVELLLEATLLALRGILAIKGSAVAGALTPAITAPTIAPTGGSVTSLGSMVGGYSLTDGIESGSSGSMTIGGFGATDGIASGSSGSMTIGGFGATEGIVAGQYGSMTIGGFSRPSSDASIPKFPLTSIGGHHWDLPPTWGIGSSSADAFGGGGSPVGRNYGISNTALSNSGSHKTYQGIPMSQAVKPFGDNFEPKPDFD